MLPARAEIDFPAQRSEFSSHFTDRPLVATQKEIGQRTTTAEGDGMPLSFEITRGMTSGKTINRGKVSCK